MHSPAGVPFFSSGLTNGPPNVEPLAAVRRGTGRSAVFFLAVIGETEEACGGGGSGVLLLFRFRKILVCGGSPKKPTAAVPPVPPEKPPVVWGTGIDALDVSSFWVLANNPPPNTGVVVEVDVEVAAPSAGLMEARIIHQAQGRLLLLLLLL